MRRKTFKNHAAHYQCSQQRRFCRHGFFAGSGSFGKAALELGRDCYLIDKNPAAIDVMKKRFAGEEIVFREHAQIVK